MNEPRRRTMGTQLGRKRNKSEVEQGWAEQAERESKALPLGHGQIVRDEDAMQRVATVKPPQKHVDQKGQEVVPYRQINAAQDAPPAQHGEGQTLEVHTAPAHQVGAPPPQQGAHHPVGHGDPRTTPQSQPQTPVYRIQASTTSPSGAQAIDPQHGLQSMQQQYGGGVQKVGGQPVQPVAGARPVSVGAQGVGVQGMPASVRSVPGIVGPEQAAQFMAQQQGNLQNPQGSQFQGGSQSGVSVGAGAQPQSNQRPHGAAEVLQESSVVLIAKADDATMRAELEAAGLSGRLKTAQTTIKRRVPAEQIAPAQRLDVTVILTCYGRSQLLRTQLDALRRGPKLPAQVVVLVVGEGPHPADVLSDGRPWRDGPLLQNTLRFGATPWTRFSLATSVPTKYVAILDDDCIPGEGWLEECVRVSELGLSAVIAAAGEWLAPDGSAIGHRGPWRTEDGSVGVSDFSNGVEQAAVVDVGGLGWFFPTQWAPSIAQLGPVGQPPYGWQLHISAALQLDGGIPTVVLPYGLEDRALWGATLPAQRDGLSTLDGMGSLRDEVFSAYCDTSDDAPGWALCADLPKDRRFVPIPDDPLPAAATTQDGQEAKLPPGTYWNARQQRYMEPTDPDWSAEHFELVTGQTWHEPSESVLPQAPEGSPEAGASKIPAHKSAVRVIPTRLHTPQDQAPKAPEPKPAQRVTEGVTLAPQVATKLDAPGTLGRAPEGAASVSPRAEPPKRELGKPAALKPAVVEAKAGQVWCACGLSDGQPFCEEGHVCQVGESVELTPELLGFKKGQTSQKVVLCMCKATKKPPFCDGSHAKVAAQAAKADQEETSNP